ncbi:kinase domain protein [Ostertagia ostertagi]
MNNVSYELNEVPAASETHLSPSERSMSDTALKLQASSSYDSKPSNKAVSDSPKDNADTSASRSEYYRLMYACLQEKFDYVQASTDRLRDRLYHVKKEVTYLKRMKRVLIRRLARYGESYSYAPLEIPDNVDIEDPVVKRRKERRERERERKEAIRAAKRAQSGIREEHTSSSNLLLHSSSVIGAEQGPSQNSAIKNAMKMTSTEVCDLSSHGYTVQQWIGHCFGGAGDVFFGRCNDSTRVAIKRIPLDALDITFDPSRAERTPRSILVLSCMQNHRIEASYFEYRLGLLRHPHIVDFHASFVDGPSIFLVLGSCNYGSASDVILSSYQCGIPEKAIALILRQLLTALVYLHAQRIIHRSIRASHLLLDSAGGVRLTGFRLARKLRPGETSTTDFDNHVEASLLWLAPEVLAQDLSGYSTSADIYSVGTALCEMANGFPPFGDMNRLEMLYEKSRGTTPRLLDSTTLPSYEEPSEHSRRTFTEAFHNITGLCLKVNPANRPDANSLLSHPFLKRTRKTLPDLMPLAQTLDQVQRVPSKKDVTVEEQNVPEWVF